MEKVKKAIGNRQQAAGKKVVAKKAIGNRQQAAGKKVSKSAVSKLVGKKVVAKKNTVAKKAVAKKVSKSEVSKLVGKRKLEVSKSVGKKVSKAVVKKVAAKKVAPKKVVAKKVTPKRKLAVSKSVGKKVSKAVVKRKLEVSKLVGKNVAAKKVVAKKVAAKKVAAKPAEVQKPVVKKVKIFKKNSKTRYKAKELNHFKKVLLDEKERIIKSARANMRTLVDSESGDYVGDDSSYASHMAEQGSDEMEREKNYMFVQRDEKYLGYIEEALTRIDQGTYGVCIDCMDVPKNLCPTCPLIPAERLEIVPITQHCIECKNIRG